MKRLLTIGLVLVSAFALTNCSEQIVPPVEEEVIVDETIETTTPEGGIPFEVYANVAEDVDTKTENKGNSTYWVANDQISVFHKITGGSTFTHNHAFTITNLANGLFSGNLAEKLGETNDWHFIYPYKKRSDEATTTVTIGAAEVPQVGASNKNHIDGEINPMYGSITGLGKNECPDVKMGHLAALVAIKIVHDGGEGPIVIKDASLSVADTPVVGDCVVTFSDGTPTITASSSNTSTITKVVLQDAVTLNEKDDFVTLYAAVRPFETSDKEITITVNGSARTLKKTVKFESGKVTTLKVPVEKLTHSVISDAFDLISEGGRATTSNDNSHLVGSDGKIITTTGLEKTIKVNGEDVEAYVIGTAEDANGKSSTGTITITGFFKDLINALPVSFYASTWNNEPAVMTVNKVTAWLPRYPISDVEVKDYWDGWTHYKDYDVTTDYSSIKKRSGAKSTLAGIALGWDNVTITREILSMLGDGVESKITFSNISQNGYFENDNIVVLNDGFAHKEVNDNNLTNFLKSFSSNGKVATTEGLRQIANIPQNELPQKAVTKEKRKVVLGSETIISSTLTTDWPATLLQDYPEAVETTEAIFGKVSPINIKDVVTAINEIPSKFELLHMLRDAKVSVELGTTADGPCIVVWGFDATLPEERPQETEE